MREELFPGKGVCARGERVCVRRLREGGGEPVAVSFVAVSLALPGSLLLAAARHKAEPTIAHCDVPPQPTTTAPPPFSLPPQRLCASLPAFTWRPTVPPPCTAFVYWHTYRSPVPPPILQYADWVSEVMAVKESNPLAYPLRDDAIMPQWAIEVCGWDVCVCVYMCLRGTFQG